MHHAQSIGTVIRPAANAIDRCRRPHTNRILAARRYLKADQSNRSIGKSHQGTRTAGCQTTKCDGGTATSTAVSGSAGIKTHP